MPRINSLDPIRRKLDKILAFILLQMKKQRINQAMIARLLGVSQQSVSMKFKNGNFSAKELLMILDYLQTTKDEYGELMT